MRLLILLAITSAVKSLVPPNGRPKASVMGQKSFNINNNPTAITTNPHTRMSGFQNYLAPSLSFRGQICRRSNTMLFEGVLMNLPDYFFTVTFPLLYVLGNVFQHLRRQRLEERAWEQRLDDERNKKLSEDPTLSEIELRKQEAEAEWSPYGPDAMLDRRREQQYTRTQKRRRVNLMEKDEDGSDDGYYDDGDNESSEYRRSSTEYGMTDSEIQNFESEYNVKYDPYYDEPYTEEELPDMPYNVDKKYGDRIYENGEIFYKDSETGLYYRQGSRPRIRKLFDS